jgi:hypothetical protein
MTSYVKLDDDIGSDKWVLVEEVFLKKKTIWSDDEREVIGYDGEHQTNIVMFNTELELGEYIEDMSVKFGEDPELGSWNYKWSGVVNSFYLKRMGDGDNQ